MTEAVKGYYKKGQITLYQKPKVEEGEVIVSFLDDENSVSLTDKGISKAEAHQLRQRLRTFETDWDAPGMEAYDKL